MGPSTILNTPLGNFAPPDLDSSWLLRIVAEQELSAVERFAVESPRHSSLVAGTTYQRLMPASPPGPGQQYAFEVDLDACSGCKACTVACHNLNGLEPNELWRTVGELLGGTSERPFQRHVTTACHHCLEPACLSGCPVLAYEKDPLTGIVRHLDDQCIGCQYCILKCPYDVPRYSPAKGIVRKCDMCSDRLSVGEPPACVAACPTGAIRIQVVDRQSVVERSEGNRFLPGAAEPDYTLPTTVYKSSRPLPDNVLPADYHTTRPAQGHWSLVTMLVLTQMSVGALAVDRFAAVWPESANSSSPTAGAQSASWVIGLAMGFLGLGASLFHLGRPQYAYRAVLGLATSWLSREIVAFGVFALCAIAYVAASFSTAPARVVSALGIAAALAGIAGVFCSVMIYVDTRRPQWTFAATAPRFFLTTLVLGIPTAMLLAGVWGADWARLVALLSLVKLLGEASVLLHLRRRRNSPLKRTASLLVGELGMRTIQRFFCGIFGGIILPLLLAAESSLAARDGYHPLFATLASALMLVLLVTGEMLERYLFFRASIAPSMPGARPR